MPRYMSLYTVVLAVLLGTSTLSFGTEQMVASNESRTVSSSSTAPDFPPSDKCSSSRPCHNVLGEITRIEESYWIRMPNGDQMHLKASRDSKMDALPRVGDKIAAQISSTGDVQAIMKLEPSPKPAEQPVPQKSLQELR